MTSTPTPASIIARIFALNSEASAVEAGGVAAVAFGAGAGAGATGAGSGADAVLGAEGAEAETPGWGAFSAFLRNFQEKSGPSGSEDFASPSRRAAASGEQA